MAGQTTNRYSGVNFRTNPTGKKVLEYVQKQDSFTVASVAKDLKLKRGTARYYVDALNTHLRIERTNPHSPLGEPHTYVYVGLRDIQTDGCSHSLVNQVTDLYNLAYYFAQGGVQADTFLDMEMESFDRLYALAKHDLAVLEQICNNPDFRKKSTLVERIVFNGS